MKMTIEELTFWAERAAALMRDTAPESGD